MAKEETSPGGLFSKMVKFVRSPGTQWNELDDPSSNKENSLSKQALKEMIERKRRNDFVRKREFDMLRKLRRRETTGGSTSDAAARPSFFQSSMPSRPDDRAMTLKKIDEIEAQMSMQWWKTKHGTGGANSTNASSDFATSDINATAPHNSAAAKSAAVSSSLAYARTAPDDLQNRAARMAAYSPAASSSSQAETSPATLPSPFRQAPDHDQANLPVMTQLSEPAVSEPPAQAISPTRPLQAPTQAVSQDNSLDFIAEVPSSSKPIIKPSQPQTLGAQPASHSTAKSISMSSLAASYDGAGAATGFSASKLFALEVDEVQHDPELEEAAIRFANGDDGGAEAGLLEAISPRGPRHLHEETWLTLFDLYRATAQYDRFESLAIDFASKFNRSSPMWFSIPEMVSKMAGNEAPAPTGMRKADWKSPANFGIQSLATLNAALGRATMPWTIDWGSIQSIDDNAVAPLTRLFLSWAMQPVQLRVANSHKFDEVLRQGTPSGVKTVDQERWNLLMAYLRVAHRPDEFELAALDFCVTYEVSPPSWESSRCEFKLLDAEGNTGVGQSIVGDAVHDSVMSELQTDAGTSIMTAQMATVELSGQIMGEPKPALDKLETRLAGADVMIISCAKLVRVDFSAAGSLLNWVTARQSEGRLVQFTDLHRLVAAFFHVIGISEHAKVSARTD
jgi:ABC-type transporter Mla MlaB component